MDAQGQRVAGHVSGLSNRNTSKSKGNIGMNDFQII